MFTNTACVSAVKMQWTIFILSTIDDMNLFLYVSPSYMTRHKEWLAYRLGLVNYLCELCDTNIHSYTKSDVKIHKAISIMIQIQYVYLAKCFF